MPVYDADAHVEENEVTFSDKYLDPAYRSRRPQIVVYGDRPHWIIDYNMFPRFSGPAPMSLGTPARAGDLVSIYSRIKSESIPSLELSDPKARLKDMQEEDIDLQVQYPTLFLGGRLSPDVKYMSALCSSYNRWMADATSGYEDKLKWVGVVNLDDPQDAAREVRQIKSLGGCGVMIGGTAGDRLLHKPELLPFWEACVAENLPVAVHVVWSSPSINNLFDELYFATILAFTQTVLIGFVSVLGTGLLDRFPTLRIAFLEAGCQWIHFLTDRMDHRYKFVHFMREQGVPMAPAGAKEKSIDYVKKGNVFFSAEVEDLLLPQAIDLVGAGQFLFASDIPHADRERFAARELRSRKDIPAGAAETILYESCKRFYGFE